AEEHVHDAARDRAFAGEECDGAERRVGGAEARRAAFDTAGDARDLRRRAREDGPRLAAVDAVVGGEQQIARGEREAVDGRTDVTGADVGDAHGAGRGAVRAPELVAVDPVV